MEFSYTITYILSTFPTYQLFHVFDDQTLPKMMYKRCRKFTWIKVLGYYNLKITCEKSEREKEREREREREGGRGGERSRRREETIVSLIYVSILISQHLVS